MLDALILTFCLHLSCDMMNAIVLVGAEEEDVNADDFIY